MSQQEVVTRLLVELREGNRDALDRLMPLVYDELREIAHRHVRRERRGHTMNTTALVHEAYEKLVDQRRAQWQNRAHFFAVAAQMMRRILVNYARQHQAAKRGGGVPDVPLEDLGDLMSGTKAEELIALDEALERLESLNERGCRVVEYRFFGGLTYEEIADVMNLSPVTVRRAWSLSKTWLRREVERDLLA